MKKKSKKSQVKLKLHRETLRALVTPEMVLAVGGAGSTSDCKSGVTCCHGGC